MKIVLNISFVLLLNITFSQNAPEINNNNNVSSPVEVLEESVEEELKAVSKKEKSSASRTSTTLDVIELTEDQNSFEYNYNAYKSSSIKNEVSFQYLQKAYAIYPDNVDLYDDFMAYYEMNENRIDRRQFSTKLYKSNTISGYLMEYNYNVLMSLPQNAILFTNGYDDTYPIWVTQDVKKVRKDVTVVNIDLLNDEIYREKVLKNANLTFKKKLKGTELVEYVVKNNSNKNIYLGLTVDKELIGKLYKNLYLVGVVFKYSTESFNNVALTEQHWENQFVKKTITETPSTFKQKQVLANYLLSFIYLHNYYVEKGEVEKAKDLKELTLKIAAYNGKQKIVASKLKE
jgi:hypothetical protein